MFKEYDKEDYVFEDENGSYISTPYSEVEDLGLIVTVTTITPLVMILGLLLLY